ncbi:MAG: hypothetical protein EA390_03965 [Balneolaceae bacterium]|nr:MAG: hypothetical protein EA390_03965 [Balneolaceae bacterium]
MKRNAIKIKQSSNGKRCIAVDEENAVKLLEFFTQNKRYQKKFNHICDLILGNHVNRELYDKEEPDDKSKGVRAMKFFKGQDNARVYCKEVTLKDKTFVVIAAEVLERKKQTKLTHKELNIIHRVAGYEYKKIK